MKVDRHTTLASLSTKQRRRPKRTRATQKNTFRGEASSQAALLVPPELVASA
ncbi:hypothetical protein LZ30DRAFT_742586 [Colletotrichum cereale]|nr:hypothetical protein LZ30DRAFT_742586 [Colletotrichum cereale]